MVSPSKGLLRRRIYKQRLIPPSGERKLLIADGTSMDTIKLMRDVVHATYDGPTAKRIANALRSQTSDRDELIDKLATFVYKSAYFVPDPPTAQRIRTLDNVLRTSNANCVSYSTAISTVLKQLGIPHKFRAVWMPGYKGFNHIYIMVGNRPIDIVPDQVQDGSEFYQRPLKTVPRMDKPEVDYIRKMDLVV